MAVSTSQSRTEDARALLGLTVEQRWSLGLDLNAGTERERERERAAGCSVALKRRKRANSLNSVACFTTSPEHQNPVAHLQKIWLCHSYPPPHS
ncbi:hypothetical protein SRHO_G00151180 [Serrasalmus rhombeus]